MNARDRFTLALAQAVSTAYYAEVLVYLSNKEISDIVDEQQVSGAEARAVLDLLDDQMLLQRQEGGHAYSDGTGCSCDTRRRTGAWPGDVMSFAGRS